MKYKVFVLILVSIFVVPSAFAGWKCTPKDAWSMNCEIVEGYKNPTTEKAKELNEKGIAVVPTEKEKFDKQMKRWIQEKTNQPKTE